MSTAPAPAPGDVEARLAEGVAEALRSSRLPWGTHTDRWGDAEWQREFWDEAGKVAAAVLAPIVADEVTRAVEPVAVQLEDPRFQRPGMQLRREWAKRLREAKP